MNGAFIAIFVILVFISKIRESMKQSSRKVADDDPSNGSATPVADSFSLQQVLAEIQKVKEQSDRAGPVPRSVARDAGGRPSLRGMMDQALSERKASKQYAPVQPREPAVVRAGPLGRQSDVPLESDVVVEQAATDAYAVAGGAAGPEVRKPGEAVPQPRVGPNLARLRDVITWREILSPPVSLREEEES